MRIRHHHFTPVAPLPGEPDPQPMFEGLDCFTGQMHVPVRSVSVDTSREAAARIKPHVARVREAIWLWLKTQGAHGATCGEICEALGISGSTCRPRLIELSGKAKWTPGLPARIQRSPKVRKHMRVYRPI